MGGNSAESRRSRIPPWPGISWPQSFTPKSRFIADITRPPRNPIMATTKPIYPPYNSPLYRLIAEKMPGKLDDFLINSRTEGHGFNQIFAGEAEVVNL